MLISFRPMLITLAVPEIFYGSVMTQWIARGFKVFFRSNLFEEDMIVLKINSCNLLNQDNL